MTKDEAETVARCIHIFRPDWPVKQVLDLIGEHYRDNVMRDILIALIVVAYDPESRSPSRILESGPWWRIALYREPDMRHVVRRMPKLHEGSTQCPDHPGEFRDSCRCCAADKLAGGNQ